jgi:hypothetical protein
LFLALRLLALAVVAAVGGVLYLAYAPAGDSAPHPFNHDRNAIWLEHRWLERDHDVAEMEELFATLRAHGIHYAYPHLIPFNSSGRLPLHSREQMRRFLEVRSRIAPELKVLPWIGGVRVGYKRSRSGTLDLSDLGQRQRIVAECRGLMDEGFDGIHLNVEPVGDGNVELLALLRALRSALGPTGILSLSAIRPGPVALPGAPNFFWTPEYYTRVADLSDQIVVMAYDTALPTPALYRRYMAYASESVTSSLLASQSHAHVLLGVPTYEKKSLMHRAGVETLDNAIPGIVAGLRGVKAGGTFEGVALYAGWTTGPGEWDTYERLWRGQKPN